MTKKKTTPFTNTTRTCIIGFRLTTVFCLEVRVHSYWGKSKSVTDMYSWYISLKSRRLLTMARINGVCIGHHISVNKSWEQPDTSYTILIFNNSFILCDLLSKCFEKVNILFTARFPDCTVDDKEYSGAVFRTKSGQTCRNWRANNNRE